MVLFRVDAVLFQPFNPTIQSVLILRSVRGFARIQTDMSGDLPLINGFLDLGAINFGIPGGNIDYVVVRMRPNEFFAFA